MPQKTSTSLRYATSVGKDAVLPDAVKQFNIQFSISILLISRQFDNYDLLASQIDKWFWPVQ